MSEEKQPELKKELPDENMEMVSGGWIPCDDQYPDGLAYACQLYTDDVFLMHRNEGFNNTCVGYMSHSTLPKCCGRCMNFLFDNP